MNQPISNSKRKEESWTFATELDHCCMRSQNWLEDVRRTFPFGGYITQLRNAISLLGLIPIDIKYLIHLGEMIGNLKCISGFEENLLVKDRLPPNPSAPWHLYGAIVETEVMYRLFLSKDFDELLYVKRNQKKPTNDISARKRSSR